MLALRILDVKSFMAAFLASDRFDAYALAEAQITTFCTFQVDGRCETDFFATDEEAKCSRSGLITWGLVRPACFGVIKGKRIPLAFKFVFFYPDELADRLAEQSLAERVRENVQGFCMNLRFDGTNLLLTTGTSMRSFSADRSADQVWDEEVCRIISEMGVSYERL